MGLVDRVQVTTQISQVTQDAILALAEAHGIDAGEYRRHLIVRAVDIAQSEFRSAHGMSAADFLAQDGTEDVNPDAEAKAAIALIQSIITGQELDPGAIALAAKYFNVAPHELASKLQGGKQNGDRIAPRSTTGRAV